jgi:hypothetical protein
MTSLVRACCLSVTAAVVVVPARADEQTEARKVIDKAITAYGGAEVLAKHALTTKMKGKFYGLGEAIEYTGTVYGHPPDRCRIELKMTVMDKPFRFIQAASGGKGWLSVNGMVQDMPKEVLAEFMEALYLQEVSQLVCLTGKEYKLSLLGEVQVDKRPAVGIRIERKDRRDINLFFDKESGLVVKSERRVKDPMAGEQEFTEVSYLRDYRKVGSALIPFKTEVKRDGKPYLDGQTVEFTASDKLDDGLFVKP